MVDFLDRFRRRVAKRKPGMYAIRVDKEVEDFIASHGLSPTKIFDDAVHVLMERAEMMGEDNEYKREVG